MTTDKQRQMALTFASDLSFKSMELAPSIFGAKLYMKKSNEEIS